MASRSIFLLASFLAFGCGDESPDDTTAGETTTDASGPTTTAPTSTASDASSSGEASSTATTAASDSDASSEGSTGVSTLATTGDDASTDASADESTGGPTSGPGVLPGETGLDAFCRRYVECGGTYYSDQQDCIDASLDYWGECTARRDALDAFGACMSEIECEDYDPDAYNPASTPCAEQWSDLQQTPSC